MNLWVIGNGKGENLIAVRKISYLVCFSGVGVYPEKPATEIIPVSDSIHKEVTVVMVKGEVLDTVDLDTKFSHQSGIAGGCINGVKCGGDAQMGAPHV